MDYNEHDISQLLNSIGEVYKKKDSSVKRMRGARLCKMRYWKDEGMNSLGCDSCFQAWDDT